MVRQPVQQGPGQPLVVGKHLGPIGKRQVRCHDQARLLIALTEEAEQVLGAHAIQRDIAQFIHNDQSTASDVLLQLQDRPLLPGLDVRVDQTRGREELCRIAPFACLPAED